MDEEVEIRFEEQQVDCSFVRFTTQDGRFINGKTAVGVFLWWKETQIQCSLKGMLRLNNEALSLGSTLKSGDVVAWITGPCTHAQIMIDMCTVCGTSLADTKFVEDKRKGLAPYVSTVHNAPDSYGVGQKKKETLLENRRLILLIDLDQILIHTTNKTSRPEEMRKMFKDFYLLRMRDVKPIVANVRNKILRGKVLVLSGIVHLQQDMEEHPFYKFCIRLGAEVVDEEISRCSKAPDSCAQTH
ncbi:RNA polymerase II subunit A C-terminal domain phosphatase [Aphelenchoides besseyi]|nr:RNA polymerase II subunit A C-terminal domain phosphatase [Aphelenchoides besseyi]